jgi:Transposase
VRWCAPTPAPARSACWATPRLRPRPSKPGWPRRCAAGGWRTEILAHHTTGASNGPVEAEFNLTLKQIKRSGRGFRNFDNYRLRILLTGQRALRETQPVTSIRPRRPW